MKKPCSIFLLTLLLLLNLACLAQKNNELTNAQQAALRFLDSVGTLQPSAKWPAVEAEYFMQNLRRNIIKPMLIYAGRNTNFCAYAALSYTLLQEDPLRYCRFMIELYKRGKATFRNQYMNPPEEVRTNAGKILYEGELDRNHADQVWFLTLADNYKGYLNWLNQKYHPGDENTLWASTNLAKFNRMLRKLTGRIIHSQGSDLIRPNFSRFKDRLPEYLKKGDVYLYLNNTMLKKKNHFKVKKKVPTHFVVLLSAVEEAGDMVITYWDAGFKTLRKVPLLTMQKIIYGITLSEPKK